MNYKKQLEDEKWQVKRRKILKRDGFKCTKCGYEDNLQVHHLYYVYYNKAWQYPHDALVTLCGRCHSKWHEEHELEFRESIYSKPNKKYNPPKKSKTYFHKKKKSKKDKRDEQMERLLKVAEKLGLERDNKIVIEIIKNNKYSMAVHLFKGLL